MSVTPGGAGLSVTVEAPDPAAFAAFGAFLEPPTRVGDRASLSQWLEPVPGCALHCHLNRVAPSGPPLRVDRVECHPHASQIFLPVGVSRYLVVVMPSDETASPDLGGARAFVVPGTTGVAYRPGVWHAGISVLDAEGSFFVAMWRGEEDDDVFVSIPPVELTVAEDARVDGASRGHAHCGEQHG